LNVVVDAEQIGIRRLERVELIAHRLQAAAELVPYVTGKPSRRLPGRMPRIVRYPLQFAEDMGLRPSRQHLARLVPVPLVLKPRVELRDVADAEVPGGVGEERPRLRHPGAGQRGENMVERVECLVDEGRHREILARVLDKEADLQVRGVVKAGGGVRAQVERQVNDVRRLLGIVARHAVGPHHGGDRARHIVVSSRKDFKREGPDFRTDRHVQREGVPEERLPPMPGGRDLRLRVPVPVEEQVVQPGSVRCVHKRVLHEIVDGTVGAEPQRNGREEIP
jgi:hypothetical protein